MIVAVRDLTERIPNPKQLPWPGCGQCRIPTPGHEGWKTRHVTIDNEGYGIVSSGVWEGLCHLVDRGGFEAVNPVPSPPRQGLNFNNQGAVTTQVFHRVQQPITAKLLQKIKKGGNTDLPWG